MLEFSTFILAKNSKLIKPLWVTFKGLYFLDEYCQYLMRSSLKCSQVVTGRGRDVSSVTIKFENEIFYWNSLMNLRIFRNAEKLNTKSSSETWRLNLVKMLWWREASVGLWAPVWVSWRLSLKSIKIYRNSNIWFQIYSKLKYLTIREWWTKSEKWLEFSNEKWTRKSWFTIFLENN